MSTHSFWPSARSRRKIELKTDISECGTFHIMSVHGRLTIDTSPDFLDEIRRAVRKASKLKVDLADVGYVDSSGISVLIQGLKLAQERSIDYSLLNPSPKVQAVIELSQLHNFFQIESSSGAGCAEPE